MQTFRKKRLDIIAEHAVMGRLIEITQEAGATGYTVLPVSAAHGRTGDWEPNPLSGALSAELLTVVAEPEIAEAVIAEIRPLFEDYAITIQILDVDVLRPEYF